MKRVLAAMVIMGTFWVSEAHAGKPLVAEAPTNDHATLGSDGCVSVSGTSWTAVPATALVGRVGGFWTVDPSTTTNLYATFDNTRSTTTYPQVFKPGLTQYRGTSDAEPLYFVSSSGGAVTVCADEVKQ